MICVISAYIQFVVQQFADMDGVTSAHEHKSDLEYVVLLETIEETKILQGNRLNISR